MRQGGARACFAILTRVEKRGSERMTGDRVQSFADLRGSSQARRRRSKKKAGAVVEEAKRKMRKPD